MDDAWRTCVHMRHHADMHLHMEHNTHSTHNKHIASYSSLTHFESTLDVFRGLALLMLFVLVLGIAKLLGSAKAIIVSTYMGARCTQKIYYDITGTAFCITTDVVFYAMIVLAGIAHIIELVSAKQYMKEYEDQDVWNVSQRSSVYLVMVGIQCAVNSAIGLIFALTLFKCLNLIPGLNMINSMITSIGIQQIFSLRGSIQSHSQVA